GRLDVVAKHPDRIGGDSVSPTLMVLHPIVLTVALVSMTLSFAGGTFGHFALIGGAALIAALVAERAIVGIRAARRFHDPTPLWFPIAHLFRDTAWTLAIVVWMLRRAGGVTMTPAHSMTARRAPPLGARGAEDAQGASGAQRVQGPTSRVLVVIPAHNEARN